jgi:hypothetical protein
MFVFSGGIFLSKMPFGSHGSAGVKPTRGTIRLHASCVATYLTFVTLCFGATLEVDDGKSCFCGRSADLQTAVATAWLVEKTQCKGTPCEGSPRETECTVIVCFDLVSARGYRMIARLPGVEESQCPRDPSMEPRTTRNYVDTLRCRSGRCSLTFLAVINATPLKVGCWHIHIHATHRCRMGTVSVMMSRHSTRHTTLHCPTQCGSTFEMLSG